MNFFHRPKTPTAPTQLPTQSGPPRSPRRSHPDLATRVQNGPPSRLKTRTAKAVKTRGKDDGSPALRQHEAVKPFDYLPVESEKLYLGTLKPFQIVETIHAKLLSDLKENLPVQVNGQLCQIFEDYRRLLQENIRLTGKERAETDAIEDVRKEHEKERRQWHEEEADYRKEIKRLETIIAHSNRGIEGVINARRNSVIRRKGSEKAARGSTMEAVGEELVQEHGESLSEFLAASSRDVLVHRAPPPRSHGDCQRCIGSGLNPKPSLKPGGTEIASSQNPDVLGGQLRRKSDASAAHSVSDSMSGTSVGLSVKMPNASPHSTKEGRSHKEGCERKPKDNTSTSSSIHTWSHFMAWGARKHQHKASQASPVTGFSEPTCTSRQPQGTETRSDLRRRPYSFSLHDELDFEGVKSPRHRHRSVSLTDLNIPEQAREANSAAELPDICARPVSLDTPRREQRQSASAERLPDTENDPIDASRRDKISAIGVLRESRYVGDGASREQSGDSRPDGTTGRFPAGAIWNSSITETTMARPSTSVVKRSKGTSEAAGGFSQAAAAAAKALTASTRRPKDCQARYVDEEAGWEH